MSLRGRFAWKDATARLTPASDDILSAICHAAADASGVKQNRIASARLLLFRALKGMGSGPAPPAWTIFP